MNTVSREGSKAYCIEPEKDLIVDCAGLVGNLTLTLVLPPDEDECDVGRDCSNDYKQRIRECCRRCCACNKVSYYAAARSGEECQNVDTEDIHLFAHTCDGTGHRESNGADNIRDQHEKFCIHGDIIYVFGKNKSLRLAIVYKHEPMYLLKYVYYFREVIKMRKKCKLLGMILTIVMIMSCFSFAVSADGEYKATGGNIWYTYTLDYDGTLNIVWQQDFGQFFCLDLVGQDHLAEVKKVVVDMSKLNDNKNFYIDGFGCCPETLEFTYDQDSKTVSEFTVANFDGLKGDDIFFKDGTTINCFIVKDMFDLENIDFIGGLNVEHVELTVELEAVKIPSGVKYFNEGTFYNCYKMKCLYIPESVESITEDAFSGCNALTDVYYAGTKEQWNTLFDGFVPEELVEATIHYGYKPGWVLNEDGSWGYITEKLDLATGWEEVGGIWYYFDDNGKMLTGWQEIDGSWYYLDNNGHMLTGWLKSGNKWYYLESSGAMKTGWKKINDTWYYLDPETGAMVTGWNEIDGVWYYFKADGSMASSEWCEGYWLGASGAWTYKYKAKWTQDDKGWWFGDTSGWYAKNESCKINGKVYNFDAEGYCTNP